MGSKDLINWHNELKVKIAILGYGIQGQSVYEYYKNTDNNITICDRDTATDLPEGVDSQIGETYLDGLDKFDLIFRGPGVHPTEIVGLMARQY